MVVGNTGSERHRLGREQLLLRLVRRRWLSQGGRELCRNGGLLRLRWRRGRGHMMNTLLLLLRTLLLEHLQVREPLRILLLLLLLCEKPPLLLLPLLPLSLLLLLLLLKLRLL